MQADRPFVYLIGYAVIYTVRYEMVSLSERRSTRSKVIRSQREEG